jgi:hypothetical protein
MDIEAFRRAFDSAVNHFNYSKVDLAAVVCPHFCNFSLVIFTTLMVGRWRVMSRDLARIRKFNLGLADESTMDELATSRRRDE